MHFLGKDNARGGMLGNFDCISPMPPFSWLFGVV